MQLHNAIWEFLRRSQLQRHLTMLRRNEGNAFAEERRHNAEDEFIDRILIEEGPDDLTTAHEPDILARLLTNVLDKALDWFFDKFEAGRGGCRLAVRENVMRLVLLEARAEFHAYVIGLAPKNLGIDRAGKLR